MPKFPFTNYHELNLDWILKKVDALFDASEENARTIRTYDTRLTSAEQTATSAETAATAAQQLADAASANADNALSVAGTANTKADSALTAATTAAGAAAGAMTTAQEARQIAGSAQSAAADAGAVANDASNAAAAAQQTADTNAGNIADLQTAVDSISTKIPEIDNKADVIIASASGSIADGANDMPFRSLVTNIEPVQAGSGDPSPTNVRPITGRAECTVGVVGVNWMPNNLTFTDGLRDDNGGQTASTVSHYSEPFPIKPNTTYKGSGVIRSNANPRIYFLDSNKNWISRTVQFLTDEFTFTTPENCYYIQVQCGVGVDLSEGMISTDQTAPVTPYMGNTAITVSWQSEAGTVYGGTLDIISGVLTVNKVILDMANLAVNYDSTNAFFSVTPPYIVTPLASATDVLASCYKSNAGISDAAMASAETGMYIVLSNGKIKIKDTRYTTAASFQTGNTGQKLYYPVTNGQTYQLTPQQINTLLGTNNIYSDSGSIADVQYPADTKLYIDGKIAELQALVLEN